MTRTPHALALLAVAALTLSGCVAAVVPIAAGGLIGNKQLRARHHRARTAKAPRTARAGAAPSAVAPTTPSAPLPTDLSKMQEGQVYTGQLPAPGAVDPTPSAAAPARAVPLSPSPSPAPAQPPKVDRNDWTTVVHYVASTSLTPPENSALLARSGSAAAPAWVPCGQKPMALIVALDAIGSAAAMERASSSLDAIETMGLTLVYTASGDPDVARAQAKALAGRVRAPVEGDTLFLSRPGSEGAARAAIAARYCAIAIVGAAPADFPNALLPSRPGASPGWFLLSPSRGANGN